MARTERDENGPPPGGGAGGVGAGAPSGGARSRLEDLQGNRDGETDEQTPRMCLPVICLELYSSRDLSRGTGLHVLRDHPHRPHHAHASTGGHGISLVFGDQEGGRLWRPLLLVIFIHDSS